MKKLFSQVFQKDGVEGGDHPDDGSAFDSAVSKFTRLRNDLLKLHATLERSVAASRALQDASLEVLRVMEGNAVDVEDDKDYMKNMQLALASMKSKILLLNEIDEQCKKYEHEHHEVLKVEKVLSRTNESSKGSFEYESNTAKAVGLRAKMRESQAELMTCFNFVFSHAPRYSAAEVVRHELDAFRTAHFESILVSQQRLQGEQAGVVNLTEQRKMFYSAMKQNINLQRKEAIKNKTPDTEP